MITAVALVLLAASALAAPAEHRIENLPGAPEVKFGMYAGHVTVDAERGHEMFYWYVESQRDPAHDPVVLWMNGGPGSSSLLGFLIEHGPFRPNPDGRTLSINENSWNRVANVVYIESPVGVGFSTTRTEADLATGDSATAADNYAFVVRWLELFPELAASDFYVAGESYGGHYVPQLVAEILARDTAHRVHLRGMLVGNPATNTDWYQEGPQADAQANAWSYLTFVWSHGLLPHADYAEAHRRCAWGRYLETCDAVPYVRPSQQCLDAVSRCLAAVPFGEIDVYDVDADVCLGAHALEYTSRWSPAAAAAVEARRRGTGLLRHDPCIFNYVVAYLNEPDVQKAVHAQPTKWAPFSPIVNYSDVDMHADMVPVYQQIFRMAPHLRVLVFSGDFDAAVPFLETQKWIACLGRPVRSGWRTWHMDGQVAGGVVEYDRISFLSIKGAGHAVSYYSPEKGFAFFDRWINNKPF
eukprot:m51a1_g3000 putative serine carboxypeptidase-like 40-like (469) ;mRNA; f:771932-773490